MADEAGPYDNNPRVSRRTIIRMKTSAEQSRKARESERSTAPASPPASPSPPAARVSARAGASVSARSGARPASESARSHTIVMRRDGDKDAVVLDSRKVSARLSARDSGRSSGRAASSSARTTASFRAKGGDTIIRYEGGRTIIKRAPRRDEVRRQLIVGYSVIYLFLFILYGVFLFTGTRELTPEEFIKKAFSKRQGTELFDLERAAMLAMKGNRTPAEVRFAEPLSFYDENKDMVRVEAGDRLTLLTAAKLGQAVIEDLGRSEKNRTFGKPFILYDETFLASLDWPFWLMLYNLLGFFLLLIIFLWKPISHYLGAEAKKTAAAIDNAKNAQVEAEELLDAYRELAADIEAKRADETRNMTESVREEGEAALIEAQKQAEAIKEGVGSAAENEMRRARRRLRENLAREACARARAAIEAGMTPEIHDRAVADVIRDIGGMKLT